MDKLEYIPGDIVKIEYGEAAGKIGFVTNAILKRKGSYGLFVFIGKEFQGSSKDDWISTYNDEVSPIPLTPEILENNGWYGATHSKLSDDNTKILYKTFKRKGYPTIKVSQDLKITCELSPFIVKLGSVSDLQHLLFGLGINHEMEV